MDNIILVKKANVQLRIDKERLNDYLARGYNRIDEKGNIITIGTPNTLAELKAAYGKIQEEMNVLAAENQRLSAALAKLNADKKKSRKVSGDKDVSDI